jgi:hypothetical protein
MHNPSKTVTEQEKIEFTSTIPELSIEPLAAEPVSNLTLTVFEEMQNFLRDFQTEGAGILEYDSAVDPLRLGIFLGAYLNKASTILERLDELGK